jgi:hypothetical protein
MQWLIPVMTAIWGVWKWSQEHQQERLKERSRLSALYVNPFLSASEDLQSRIYHILCLNGLRFLRERYPAGIYAEETLYLIVRWFGWFAVLLRYSPYTQDPIMIRLAEAVRNAFASPAYPVGPFTFLRPEQRTLGKMVMSRYKGQYGMSSTPSPGPISWSGSRCRPWRRIWSFSRVCRPCARLMGRKPSLAGNVWPKCRADWSISFITWRPGRDSPSFRPACGRNAPGPP